MILSIEGINIWKQQLGNAECTRIWKKKAYLFPLKFVLLLRILIRAFFFFIVLNFLAHNFAILYFLGLQIFKAAYRLGITTLQLSIFNFEFIGVKIFWVKIKLNNPAYAKNSTRPNKICINWRKCWMYEEYEERKLTCSSSSSSSSPESSSEPSSSSSTS